MYENVFDCSTLFLCDFDPAWYPFDVQTCTIKIRMDRDEAFVRYNASEIKFTGRFKDCFNGYISSYQ